MKRLLLLVLIGVASTGCGLRGNPEAEVRQRCEEYVQRWGNHGLPTSEAAIAGCISASAGD